MGFPAKSKESQKFDHESGDECIYILILIYHSVFFEISILYTNSLKNNTENVN